MATEHKTGRIREAVRRYRPRPRRMPGVKGDFRAGLDAVDGAALAFRKGRAIRIQAAVGVLVTLVAWRQRLSRERWALLALTFAAVLGSEAANTALEELANYVQPGHDERIREIKHLSAGAVFIHAGAAVAVFALVLAPRRRSSS